MTKIKKIELDSLTQIKLKQNKSTGFQSAGDDFSTLDLNLHDLLVTKPNSTFFLRINDSLEVPVGVEDQILVVDKSLHAADTDLVVAVIDGELTLTRLIELERLAANRSTDELEIWGVVTSIITQLRR